MNPQTPTQIPQLTDEQKKQYNTYRAAGMPPERALAIATKDSDNTYNPAIEEGLDNILFGEKSLTSAVGKGLKEAATGGFKEVYDDTKKYGAGFALLKSPLSMVAGAGRGVGDIVGGVFETADDLTGEVVSNTINPTIEAAIQSDLGQKVIGAGQAIDEAGRGIPSDILDSLNLLGVTAVVKGGTANTFKNAIINKAKTTLGAVDDVAGTTGKNLKDFIKAPVQKTTDAALEAGIKVVENVKKIPEAISTAAKEAVDRKIVSVATENPELAKKNILDLYKRGIVPGVKKKNKTVANIENIDEAIQRTVPRLAQKTDEAGEFVYDVQNIEDFARTISLEKKDIFSKIEKGLTEAGESGKVLDTKSIVDELDVLLKSERAEFSSDLRRAIEKAKEELIIKNPDGSITPKTISPSGAQDLLADINAQLQSFYRGSTPGTNADVIVNNLIANNLRKNIDDVVENLGDGSFKDLKNQYGDLKKMEDDVVHRAVFEAQKGSGLSDFTDVLSAGDVLAGAVDPAFLAKGVGQYLTKELIKSLSDKDELIRQMFLYGKMLKTTSP